jgi:hypothetical protein
MHTNAMQSGRVNTWGLRGTLAAVGISVVVAGIGGAAIYAATGGGLRTVGMTGGYHDSGGPPRHSNVAAPAADPAALHGEFVVPDGSGGFTTVLSQTGRVTAISAGSVTARSDDGFSQTYVIAALGPAANTPPFAVNDAVTIWATRTGSTASVTSIDYARTGGGAAAPSPVAGHN